MDNLEVAQFIYLLLNNEKIRDVIDTIGKKAVLILGRFTAERKAVLDAIRHSLRNQGYLPILFDFDKPSTRDTQETIVTLADISRFIVADITDPKSISQELASIVPNFPSVPVQPVLQKDSSLGATFSAATCGPTGNRLPRGIRNLLARRPRRVPSRASVLCLEGSSVAGFARYSGSL